MKEIFIIGGGSSLKTFNWKSLEGRITIGINKSYQSYNSTYLFWADSRFYNWYHKDIDTLDTIKISSSTSGKKIQRYYLTGPDGLDKIPGYLRGNNSGHQAINLAYHLGAKRIFLLGFDMQGPHFHSGYPTMELPNVYTRMLDRFTSLVEPLKEVGIEIYNCSQISKIKCFPKINYNDL